MQHIHDWITPRWPAPANIRACTTTRNGGFSNGEYTSMNLGDRTDDSIISIAKNRNQLIKALDLPTEPCWLYQAHTDKVVRVDETSTVNQHADASYSTTKNVICAVLTADCLPLLLCNREGSAVAAIHAGWRGLASGIVENTVKALMHFTGTEPKDIMVWMGPAIGPGVFEVGPDVYDAFVSRTKLAKKAFYELPVNNTQNHNKNNKKWLANMYVLARQCLARMDIKLVFGGEFCTVTQYQRFYSYRRDKETGRMASLIWMQDSPA